MKKVLVTGAGGYIGSVLTTMLFARGYDVVALDRFFFGRETLPPENGWLRVLQNDIRWIEKSCLKGIDYVIDLAALSNDPSGELDPEKTWEINHLGRIRIARLAKKMGVQRYIFPSSCSVYGFQEGLLDETSSVNPLTTYAKANLRAEQDILPLVDDSFCVVILRQATVYGLSPRMRFDLAINGMVRGFFKNGKLPILRDGTQWRPFIHVKDTARAMILMLEASKDVINGQIFNVGCNDQNVQIMPLAKMVAETIGVQFEYEWYGLPENYSYIINFRKIQETVGFKAEFTLNDGVKEVYGALKKGVINPDDLRMVTVQWYKHLIEMQRFLKEIEIRGVLL